jgi:hypothetical protein
MQMKGVIKDINNSETLLKYLNSKLNWPIEIDYLDDLDDLYFDYTAEELGIKSEDLIAKIRNIKQLRPISDNQPWGIFIIEFEPKKIPVTALRKILSALVPSKRKENLEHEVWNKEDLLFFCFFGNSDNRTVGVAHFSDSNRNLPTLKVICCATKYAVFEELNKFQNDLSKLEWVSDTSNVDEWRKNWSKVFTTEYRETIKNSKTLASSLASLAKRTRDYILEIYNIETANGYIHLLYDKFKNNLIHDLSIEQFGDMYAQTIAYGLFSARCMYRKGHFELNEVVDKIPDTNPFLKELMKECFTQTKAHSLSFDELELGEIVDLLDNTDTEQILKDFNRQTGEGREDPVIYFYEGFLAEYESEEKKRRGVYYTPLPVVDFIVRAVDDILKKEFGYEDGLADVSTKKESIKVQKKTSSGTKNMIVDVPAIQLLDPATGTGTFLRQTIVQIWENFKEKNKRLPKEKVNELWNDYVPKHLLPRLNGFELMMAPYAVAHMKLALVLKETGYDFKDKERINVLLTNSLEEAGSATEQLSIFDDALAIEAVCANKVKKEYPINVIIGNPPYNVSSANRNEWILELINDYKLDLNERKLNLDDDYIKFIKLSQYIIEKSGQGVVCLVTNNSYIDGITHRRIRESLLESFDKIYICDLHGNVMKKEKSPDGSKDGNIFDITQGVAICILVKSKSSKKQVYHYDLFGSRESKYKFLMENNIDSVNWTKLKPSSPEFFFVPHDDTQKGDYQSGFKVSEIFKLYNSGIQTKCDALSVHFTKKELQKVLNNFKDNNVSELKEIYTDKSDSSGWNFSSAKQEIINNNYQLIKYYYRPFDVRHTIFTGKSGGFIGRSREIVMKNIVNHGENLSLCMMRQFFQDTIYNHIFISNLPIDERTLYSNRGGTYIFPLYTYSQQMGIKGHKQYNFNEKIINKIEKCLDLKISFTKSKNAFTGEELICYIYAILYSNLYREKYNDHLKYDFPSIVYPVSQEAFYELASLGSKIIKLHLPDSYCIDEEDIGETLLILEKYSFDSETSEVILNKTFRISAQNDFAWSYEIGGYKPAQKWLKDRVGKGLHQKEINVYNAILNAITSTFEISKEIDVVMRKHDMV